MPEPFLGLSWISSLLFRLILPLRINDAEVEAYISSIPQGDFRFGFMTNQLKECDEKMYRCSVATAALAGSCNIYNQTEEAAAPGDQSPHEGSQECS